MRRDALILIPVLIASLLAAGCKSGGNAGLHAIGVIDTQTQGGHPLHGRTNLNIWLYKADSDVTLRILNTDGFTLVEHKLSAGKVGLVRKSPKFKRTYEPGEELPAWVLELFPDGGREMAAAMGFVVAEISEPPPPKSDPDAPPPRSGTTQPGSADAVPDRP